MKGYPVDLHGVTRLETAPINLLGQTTCKLTFTCRVFLPGWAGYTPLHKLSSSRGDQFSISLFPAPGNTFNRACSSLVPRTAEDAVFPAPGDLGIRHEVAVAARISAFAQQIFPIGDHEAR